MVFTMRQLHRILRSLSLYRRHEKSSTNEIVNVVSKELEGSSSQFGYRQMHQKIRSKGFVTDRETVRLIIKTLDPKGV